MTELVSLHRRVLTGQDAYHDDVYNDVTEAVEAIAFAPGASVEVTQGRDTITTQPTIYLPSGTALDGLSAITVQGVRYEVDGTPRSWQAPWSTWAPGIEVRLREITG